MAAAIILIPEMLSGPDRESADKQAERAQGAIKTYTIDLNQSPGATPSSAAPDNRAPPPEEPAQPSPSVSVPPAEQLPVAQPQVSPESVAQAPTVAPEVETPAAPPPRRDDPLPAVAESPPPRQIAAQPARAEAPPPPKVETSPPRPVASAPSAPTSSASPATTRSGWAVQLGSYSSEATAERLVKEWRAKGQDAFVMPVKSGGKTLYRVRIGPTKDRAGSEAALKAVKSSIPGAAVVAHP